MTKNQLRMVSVCLLAGVVVCNHAMIETNQMEQENAK